MAIGSQFIHRPQRFWLRRIIFQVHLWTGIGVGLYVLLIGVTGSALVFRAELSRLFGDGLPSRIKADRPLSFAQLQRAAEKACGGYHVTWIHNNERSDQAVEILLQRENDTKTIFLDRGSGRMVAERRAGAAGFLEWLADLHFNLLGGSTGRVINGIGAAFLALLCLTGSVIWWPGIKNWRRGVSVKWTAKWKRLNWDFHSATGFWTLLFLLMWAVTGIYFAFPGSFLQAVNFLAPLHLFREDEPSPQASEGNQLLDIEILVSKAEAATPGRVTTWIGLAHEDNPQARIDRSMSFLDDSRDVTYVLINAISGEIDRIESPDKRSFGDTVLLWLAYLHFGNFGGIPIKVVWVILGLAPPVLFVTGFLMWWNRVLSKKLAKHR